MSKRATREAFGKTLSELVDEGYDIVAVDADLAGSTKSGDIAKKYPDRLVDVGIAEQNMMGVAAGLSMTGRIAFTSSFAVFGTGRCWDQIRNTVCDTDLNVKVCPTHAGVTTGEDGATHQSLEDIALMRVLPNMRVLVPADYNATRAALRLAAKTYGPFYVRMGRFPVEDIYPDDYEIDLPVANVLREGKDLSIMACGVEVSQALEAAEKLAAEGIDAEVVDVFSIKPLDEETILASAKKTGLVLSCEEHSVRAGMGSALAELFAAKMPTKMGYVGMTTFGTTAPGDVLLKHFKLDADGIYEAAKALLAQN
jgi:transketolase